MAGLERATKEETNISAGRIWTSPDGTTNEQAQAMGRTVNSLVGGKQVMLRQLPLTSGRAADAVTQLRRLTGSLLLQVPNFPQSNVLMRPQIEASIAGAYGVGGV